MLPAWALAMKVTGLRGAGVGSGGKDRNQGFRCRDATGSTWMSVGPSDTEVRGSGLRVRVPHKRIAAFGGCKYNSVGKV